MKRIFVCLSLYSGTLLFSSPLQAQQTETVAGRVSPKELTIPPSPIFDLMGATPSQVTRLGDIKDFKVDWSLKYGVNPNLAIQAQPFWEFFYNRNDLGKYQNASGFMRKLASVDLSFGSIQDESSYRRIGGALKINVYREKDPLMAKELYEDIGIKYKEEKVELEKQLAELKAKLDTVKNILEKPALRTQIKAVEEQLNSQNSKRMGEINERAKIFVDEYWNSSSLDIALGRMYTFKSDSLGTFGMKRNNRSTGWGAWLSGNLGMGKKFLLTGIFRSFWYDEQLDFVVADQVTGTETPQKVVAKNSVFSTGLNLRYGGSIYTFFIEMLYEYKKLNTPEEILNRNFKTSNNVQVIGSSLKWDDVHPNTLTFGGDWRISRSVIINYGMRCVFNSDWKFKEFTPVATISCMMR